MKVLRKDFEREIVTDDSPDLSHIGEYSNTPGPKDRTIDREKRGDMGWHEYRYFIAAMSAKDTGNRLSVGQDYKRMEDYNRGEWGMVCVRATIELKIPHGQGFITQTITTPGLWGIESDSGEDCFNEIFREECATLEEMLNQLGTIELVD